MLINIYVDNLISTGAGFLMFFLNPDPALD